MRVIPFWFLFGWILFALSASVPLDAWSQDFERGRALYQQSCASCHGDRGVGVADYYDAPLHGDLSVVELTRVIQETMPEDAPGSLSLDDAQLIALYSHHEFYSPMAQLRNAPPRVELSHLTVHQFRRSVLDLMIPFTHRPENWTDERGLKRTIHQGDWGKDRKRIEERIDAQLVFDWGEGKPSPEVDHEKWQVRWGGSIFAPTTGTYEFVLDATLRANLFINDDKTPLIDASVVSFEKSLNTATIFLVGGQSYHFALDVSRSKESTTRVSVEWRPPSGIREPIPARHLSPTWSPSQLVCSTAFPPDDSSVGYERGRNVSREWYEANVAAAIEIGNLLTSDLKRWMPNDANDPNNADLVRSWCHRWVSIALRHTLSEEEKRHYVDLHFEGSPSIDIAVKKVCILTLTSPSFLYPGVREQQDEANVAMLALFLWDSVPEEWMLETASRKEAHESVSLQGLADRMLQDVRFRNKLQGFLHEFLGVRHLRELAKDSVRFPEFNDRIASDLRASFDLFVDEFANQPSRDVRPLLTADYLYLNGRLAKLYGVALPDDAPFQKVPVPREQWAGALSHPYLMSSLAYHNASSPIHRGVFVAKRLLGRSLRPPVDAIIPLSEDTAPGLTTRERVSLQTSGAMCQSCHRVINPLGFVLENFDSLGRFRNEELGKAIDATGQYTTLDGKELEFRGVRDLADFMAESTEVRQSIVRQMFQHLVKQPIAAYGLELSAQTEAAWLADGCSLQSLARSLAILGLQKPDFPGATLNDQVSLIPSAGTESASK